MTIHRVFLDANILFSMSWKPSSLIRLIDLARTGQCALMASGYVLEEARRNLPKADQKTVLENIMRHVALVPEADPTMACPLDLPSKDRPVFMSAALAQADFFLTGDIRHFGPFFGQTVLGVRILTAREYLLEA
ncbi:MAG: PIN domain-containing protein [Deltaproteobacteria bacterium]|nr:PIN domain-containing protein [Deltaproteobacteria bacterium]